MKEKTEQVIEVQKNAKLDDEKKWCVYCHTSPSGKRYIGITSKNPPERRWENGFGYRRNSHFWNAIKLYGWQHFQHDILFDNLTLNEANKKEIELISFYKSNQRDFGYNIEPGGGASTGISEETKIKMRENHYDASRENNPFYGKHHTEEAKEKMRQARIGKYIGENSPKYGTHPSEETRKKMSEAQKRREPPTKETRQKMSEQRIGFKNNAAKRPVYCIELDEIFWGAMEVRNKYGINDNSIRFAIKNIRPYAGKHPITGEKLHWLYAESAIEQEYITQKDLSNYFKQLKKGND